MALIWATGAPSSRASLRESTAPPRACHEVAHVEQDQSGQAEGEDGCGQHELAGEVERVEDKQDGIGPGGAGHFALEHVDGDAGVFRVGGEGVDAGQVDEGEVVAADAGHEAHALLDGDAGVVGHLLAEAGEAIEESGLAGVGRADEDDGAKSAGSGGQGRLEGRGFAAGVHRAASARGSGAVKLRTISGSAFLTRMALAVSRRRAISMPSTE